MQTRVAFDSNFESVATIPRDLAPRIRDYASINFNAQIRGMMFRAQHFSFGIDASQYFLDLTAERFRDLRDDLAEFPPHPFDTYTFTFWVGDAGGQMVECMCLVQPHPDDNTPQAALVMMRWGDPDTINHTTAMMSREDALDAPEDVASDPVMGQVIEVSRTAWKFIDVFRLLMARQQGVVINKGGPAQAATRKGKRVHFYKPSEIKIDLDAVKRDVIYHTGHGVAPRAYQYRAHLCHSGGKERGCDHFWIEIGGRMDTNLVWHPDAEHPRSNATWECYHCGRRRWHRKAGQRGDASKGYAQQSYGIVKGGNDSLIRSQL